MTSIRKSTLQNVKKVLIKIGSAVLTGKDGLDLQIIEQLVDEMAELRKIEDIRPSLSPPAPSPPGSTVWASPVP